MIFHAWSLYPFGTLTWWWYWLIHLLVLAYWFCSSHDYLTYFGMYIHIVVYLVCLNVDYPACILSWLFFLACYPCCYSFWLSYSHLASCVDMGDILVLCMTAWCMTALFLCVCMFLACVGYTSIPLLPILWFWSFPSFWFLHLQVWGIVCTCFSKRASG